MRHHIVNRRILRDAERVFQPCNRRLVHVAFLEGERLLLCNRQIVDPVLVCLLHNADQAQNRLVCCTALHIRLIDHHVAPNRVRCERPAVTIQNFAARRLDHLFGRAPTFNFRHYLFAVNHLHLHQAQAIQRKHHA